MIFLVYIGSERGLKFWYERVRLHALWLGLDIDLNQWDITSQNKISFVNIHFSSLLNSAYSRKITNTKNSVILKSNHGVLYPSILSTKDIYNKDVIIFDEEKSWIAIIRDFNKLSIYLWCGLIDIDHIYYRYDKESIVISNDLRLLIPKDTINLCPAAVYSLFQFGAVSAPFTLSKDVKRVPPGHLLQFSRQEITEQFLPHSLAEFHDTSLVTRTPEEMIEETLLLEIDKIPPDSGLLFSGGVDSGLLAALTKRRQRFDLRLINCDFSACFDSRFPDQEAKLAYDMAVYLGHQLHVFHFDVAFVYTMIERIGKDYTFPVGDYSTIPTNLLVHYAASLFKSGSWVVDGTGSDGIFLGSSSWDRLNRMYQIPWSIRKLLALLYRYEKILNDDGWLSRHLGLIRQSLQIPPLQVQVITQSRLAGIAFLAEQKTVQEVLQVQNNYLKVFLQDLDDRMQLSLFDLIHVCVGIYAAKDYNPLRYRGVVPFFPFLSEKMIKVGFNIMKNPQELQEEKRALKYLLLRYVPYEMIYRPKSGFNPPIESILANNKVKEYIYDVVLSKNNPLRGFVYPKTVEEFFQSIWNGKRIYKNHINFLWSYIFVSIWFDQQLNSYHEPKI